MEVNGFRQGPNPILQLEAPKTSLIYSQLQQDHTLIRRAFTVLSTIIESLVFLQFDNHRSENHMQCPSSIDGSTRSGLARLGSPLVRPWPTGSTSSTRSGLALIRSPAAHPNWDERSGARPRLTARATEREAAVERLGVRVDRIWVMPFYS
jgi:hypothetical protein